MSPDPAPPSRTIRPIGRFGVLVVITLGVWCALQVLFFVRWLSFTQRFGSGIGGAPEPMPTTAEELRLYETMVDQAKSASILLMWCTLITGVAFVLWLFRARANAEVINPAPQARGRVWLVLGWLVPIVNFWFPFQVVRGIWRTSDPARPRTSWLIVAWWVAYLGYLVTAAFGTSSLGIRGFPPSTDVPIVVSVPLGIVAAVLAAVVVLDISRTQDRIAATLSSSPAPQ